MWEKIDVPPVPKPIAAMSFPHEEDYSVIWTAEGLFRVRLTTRPHVSKLMSVARGKQKFHAESGSVEVTNTVRPIRLAMHGRCAELGTFRDSRLTATHAHGDRVEIDAVRDEVRVVDAAENCVLTIPRFRSRSPLSVAGFCGYRGYFLACDGESFHAYRYRENRKGVAKKFQAYDGETQDSLSRACLGDPDNDVPRLAYADWLDEHGDPERALFIRLQCGIAERQRNEFVPPDDPAFLEAQALHAQHGERWAAERPRPVGVDFRRAEFYRGFPVPTISSPAKASTKPCRATLAENYPLDALGFAFFMEPKPGSPFWNWPALARVRSLSFHCAMEERLDDYVRLLRLTEFAGVRQVHFRGWYSAVLSNALLEGPIGSGVDYLSLAQCFFDDDRSESIEPLAAGRTLPKLKTIVFFGDFNEGIERNEAVRRLARKYPNVIRVTGDTAGRLRWERCKA